MPLEVGRCCKGDRPAVARVYMTTGSKLRIFSSLPKLKKKGSNANTTAKRIKAQFVQFENARAVKEPPAKRQGKYCRQMPAWRVMFAVFVILTFHHRGFALHVNADLAPCGLRLYIRRYPAAQTVSGSSEIGVIAKNSFISAASICPSNSGEQRSAKEMKSRSWVTGL